MTKFNVHRSGVFTVRGKLCYEVEAETATEAAAKVASGEAWWDDFNFRDIVETDYIDDYVAVYDENGKIVVCEVIADDDESEETE